MLKTTFTISKMDCPAEERMIRMKLEEGANVHSLTFDLPGRRLEVIHTGSAAGIASALDSLQLDASLMSSEPADAVAMTGRRRDERRVLWQVLLINGFFFALESLTGFIAGSMGLVADSLDMLADSIVYGLALLAVGGTVSRKKRIAKAAGYFQMALAVLGLAEVIRRVAGQGDAPDVLIMIVMSCAALAGNASCLYLLQKSKSRDAHMKASMIFTSNDVIVNLGVIIAGVLVFLTASRLPDLAVGTIVFILVAYGSQRILQLSK